MTGLGAVLRVDGMFHVVIRRAIYRSALQRRLLKHALETRPYVAGIVLREVALGITVAWSRKGGAGEGIRTPDFLLGKQTLCH